MPSCRHTTESITDLNEGALSFWRAWALRFHLSVCPHCSEVAKQLGQTSDVVGGLPRETPAESVRDHLLDEFRKRDKK